MRSTFLQIFRLLWAIPLAVAALHPVANAEPSGQLQRPVVTGPENGASHSSLQFDQVIARVPAKQAPLAAVALAQIEIALYEARNSAAATLCPGNWTPRGPIHETQGPYPADPLHADRKSSYWIYQSLREPVAVQCGQVSRSELFLEISRHLPDWILIRPAGQTVAYRRGKAVPGDHASMVAYLQ